MLQDQHRAYTGFLGGHKKAAAIRCNGFFKINLKN
jgi:hypothetical protein